MKRQTLVNGLLSLTVVSLMTGCVDDKYDLSDIDSTSKFIVDDLTVPIKLSTIKLENVINFDGNDLIDTVNGEYVITKGGDIDPTEFSLGEVYVPAPYISPSSIGLDLSSFPYQPGTYVPVEVTKSLPFTGSDPVGYEFKMTDVNEALKCLENVKTTDITIDVILSVPGIPTGNGNEISFSNVGLTLPTDLIDVTGVNGYDPETGKVTINNLTVGSDGKAVLTIKAKGLQLGAKGEVRNHTLTISGNVGLNEGTLNLKVKDFTVPQQLEINVKYEVSGFSVKSFSGRVEYNMADIDIAPIELNDLPEFLDNSSTNLIIANPTINVKIKNPVAKYGLQGTGTISFISNFSKGESIESKVRTSKEFTIGEGDAENWTNLTFVARNPQGENEVLFENLGYVLTIKNEGYQQEPGYDPNNPGFLGLPKSIKVCINDLNFYGNVTDVPLGNLGTAEGHYDFTAPLGFGNGSKVIYESTQDGWGGDDLDDININKIHLSAKCTTNLPVSVQLSVVPLDKNGNDISVSEDSGNFKVPANAKGEDVSLLIQGIGGNPIKNFDGVRFIATVIQDEGNTEAIGPNLTIELNDLRVTVDGYYETSF